MSLPHNDAVLDRVLTRIVSAGNQKAQGPRSPGRGFTSVFQRDTGASKSVSGVDKRRTSSSTAKLHATYRLGNATFGTASRDSSLAGTNTLVPQIVFSKSILKVSGPLLLPVPSAAGLTAPAPAAAAAPAAAPTSSKASSLILRQPPQPRNTSPQPQLHSARWGSPPPAQPAASSARSRSSPRDTDTSNGGISPRILRPNVVATLSTGATGQAGRSSARSRSSPREQPVADIVVSPRGGRGGAAAASLGPPSVGRMASPDGAILGRRVTVHGEPPTAEVSGGLVSADGGGAQRGGRGANTITRTAALRALKQQRATTPDQIAELREAAAARSSSVGGAVPGSGSLLPETLSADLSFVLRPAVSAGALRAEPSEGPPLGHEASTAAENGRGTRQRRSDGDGAVGAGAP